MSRTKNIFDYSHVKQVSCFVLSDKETKEITGKIIANWSDNPNGSVCTAQVILFNNRKYGLEEKESKTRDGDYRPELAIDKAGGCGYDKLSAAIWYAMKKGFKDFGVGITGFDGRGESAVIAYFDSIGIHCYRLM